MKERQMRTIIASGMWNLSCICSRFATDIKLCGARTPIFMIWTTSWCSASFAGYQQKFFFFLFLVYGCICFRRVIETPRDRKSVAFLEQNFVLAEKRVNEFCFLFFFFGFVKFHYAVELKLSFSSLLLQDDEGGWHYSHLYAPRLRVTYILDLWFINSIKCISCSGLFEDSNSWKCIATQPRASLLFSWSLLRCLRLFWQQLLPRVRKKRSDLFSPW